MSIHSLLEVNPLIDVDTYKGGHGWMIPKDVTDVYSVICGRKPFVIVDGEEVVLEVDELVMSGGQVLAKYFESFNITQDMVDEAEIEYTEQGLEFDREYFESLIGKKLPLSLKCVPDGTVVPVNVPLVAISVSAKYVDDKSQARLPSFVETVAQRYIWKMTTVATITYHMKKLIIKGMAETAGHFEGIDYMLHNFGSRGADSGEANIKAAIAHLQIFSGTDALDANRYIKKIFDTTKAYGSSINATEHSIMCMNSDAEKRDDFKAAEKVVEWLEYEVERKGGFAMVAGVIDTYDAKRFAGEYIGERLKDRVINSGGCLVLRPDSGDPVEMPCDIVEILMDKFGYTTNDLGYKVLPPFIRVIQGDGISIEYFPKMIKELHKRKLSMENFAFGCGSGLTHEHGRDTLSFAQKATAMFQAERGIVELFKDPITDSGKRSHRGIVLPARNLITGEIVTMDYFKMTPDYEDMFVELYDYGELKNMQIFDQVRENCYIDTSALLVA